MGDGCCVRGKVKFISFKSTAASFDWGFCTLHLSVYLQCLPHALIVSIPLFSDIKLFVALRNLISNRGKKLHCRTTLIGINAQLRPFKCITQTVGRRFQQHSHSHDRTTVTLLTGSAACTIDWGWTDIPMWGVRKIFIALDQSHMLCELIVSLFCVYVCLSMNVCMMGWLAPDADYWNRLSWAVVSGAED